MFSLTLGDLKHSQFTCPFHKNTYDVTCAHFYFIFPFLVLRPHYVNHHSFNGYCFHHTPISTMSTPPPAKRRR